MITQVNTVKMTTFPARPINGGKLEEGGEKVYGESRRWAFEPKYNGWRVWVHTETGACFNRHGKPLSISHELTEAVDRIVVRFARTEVVWIDAECLSRRHHLGKGALIVLDAPVINKDAIFPPEYQARRELLEYYGLSELPIHIPPEPGAVHLTPTTDTNPVRLYRELEEENKRFNAEFYEGIVAKRKEKPYPQVYTPDKEFPWWIKHRFI